MADENEVVIRISFDEKDLSGKSEKASKDFAKSFTSDLSANLKGGLKGLDIGSLIGGAAIGTAIGGLIASGIKGAFNLIASSISEGVQSAIKQEESLNKLNIALKNTGKFSTDASVEMDRLASSLEKTTNFEDDVIIENAALLQSLGKLENEGLKRATKASIDLAAGLGVDLRSATLLVGKAAQGEISSFSRYGISIQKAGTDAETFERVLSSLENRFGGSAASRLQTYGGRVDALSISWANLKEAAAAYLTTSTTVNKSIELTTSILNGLTSATAANTKTLTERVATEKDGLVTLQETLARYESLNTLERRLTGISDERIAKLKAEIAARQDLIGSLRTQQATEADIQARSFDFSKASQEIEAAKAIGLTKEQIAIEQFNRQKELLASAKQAELDTVNANAEIEFANVEELNTVKLEQLAMYNESKALINEEYSVRELELAKQQEEILAQIRTQGANKRLDIDKKSNERALAINTAISQAMTTVVSQGIQAMVKSLITGENAFEAFGKALAGTIGTMAIQLGETLILSGLGVEALKSLGGAAAIAAGAGLIAIGTILKSFSGGASTGASGGGGLSPVGGEFAAGGSLSQPEERLEPETRVNVNISGDVFDTDETGLRIASILKESSLNNNIKVVGVI